MTDDHGTQAAETDRPPTCRGLYTVTGQSQYLDRISVTRL